MENVAYWFFAAAAVLTLFLVAWAAIKITDFARQRYRKHVWETALYVVQERPDLVRQVAAQHELSPSKELAIVPRRPSYGRTIDGLSRAELEEYAHTLEDRIRTLYDHWANEHRRVEYLNAAYARAERLRARYWGKIKRVIAAEAEGVDLFPILHPYLARISA